MNSNNKKYYNSSVVHQNHQSISKSKAFETTIATGDALRGCGKEYIGKNSLSHNVCGTPGCLCPECSPKASNKSGVEDES